MVGSGDPVCVPGHVPEIDHFVSKFFSEIAMHHSKVEWARKQIIQDLCHGTAIVARNSDSHKICILCRPTRIGKSVDLLPKLGCISVQHSQCAFVTHDRGGPEHFPESPLGCKRV